MKAYFQDTPAKVTHKNVLRSDRDGEFISSEFNELYITRGIKGQV